MGEPVIYFLELVGTGKVKIGKSKCLGNRLRQYRLHYDPSQELRLLKTVAGYTGEEMAIQAMFAEHCVDATVSKEWFWLEPIREQIMDLEGVHISPAQAESGKAERVIVVSDVCGHEKESSRRHQAEARRSACQKCCGKLHWASLSEEDRKGQVTAFNSRGMSQEVRERIARSTREHAVDRRSDLRCIVCGTSLPTPPVERSLGRVQMYCDGCRGERKGMGKRGGGRRPEGFIADNEGRRLMLNSGLSQAAIAKALGCCLNSVHGWWTGKKIPSEGNRRALFARMGIPFGAWTMCSVQQGAEQCDAVAHVAPPPLTAPGG